MSADAELVDLMGPQLELLLPQLDERSRRLVLGAVARAAGDGGITAVAKATGASWQTVANGATPPEAQEDRFAEFYSGCDAVVVPAAGIGATTCMAVFGAKAQPPRTTSSSASSTTPTSAPTGR